MPSPTPLGFIFLKAQTGWDARGPFFVGKNDARAQRQDARSVPAGSGGSLVAGGGGSRTHRLVPAARLIDSLVGRAAEGNVKVYDAGPPPCQAQPR